MRRAFVSIAVWGLALLSVAPASGQEPRGGVVRTEIYNGATRTVRYNSADLSPGEARSLQELERLENEISYLRDLDGVKREYVASERILEPHRRLVQQALYGVNVTGTSYTGYSGGAYPTGVRGAGWGGYGYGYGGYGDSITSGGGTTVNRSLSNGVGYEGALKTALATTIAGQATAEYALAVSSASDRALVRASGSPTLRVAMGLPADGRGRADGAFRPVAGEVESPVTLTLASGEKVRGTRMDEKGNWIIVTLSGGRQLRLRESEVVRIETAPSGTKPAAGD